MITRQSNEKIRSGVVRRRSKIDTRTVKQNVLTLKTETGAVPKLPSQSQESRIACVRTWKVN